VHINYYILIKVIMTFPERVGHKAYIYYRKENTLTFECIYFKDNIHYVGLKLQDISKSPQ